MKKTKQLSITFLLLGLCLVSGHDSEARTKGHKNKSSGLCPDGIATSTMYFIPDVKDYCSTSQPCSAFKKEVRMEGSGTLPGNKLLTPSGKVQNLGTCRTAFGASGQCLTPFISVAADPRFYSMGDIIAMPSLKGKTITLPDGSKMIHPGYLVVQDTGGAIKGENRFDFFTGSYNLMSTNNAFGVNGDSELKISDKKQCVASKSFSVVRRGSTNYGTALAEIDKAVDDSQTVMYASNMSRGGSQ